MRKDTKPSRGCAASGFTFVDASGNLVQTSWDGLRSRGEALFVFEDGRWRRVRSTDQVTPDGLLRFAVGPRDADAGTLERRSVTLPGAALTGGLTDAVERARRLAALPRSLVEDSNLWRDLGPLDREVVALLRRSSEPMADATLMALLATGRFAGSSLSDFLGVSGAGWAERVPVPAELVSRLSFDDMSSVAAIAQAVALTTDGPSVTDAAKSLLGLVGGFLDAEDPVAEALAAAYGVPSGPRWQMVNAVRLLQSLGVSVGDAYDLAGSLGEQSSAVELGLVDWVLRRHPHDLDRVRSVVAEFREDPIAATREHGNVLLEFSARFPQLSSSASQSLIRSCGIHPFDPVSETTDRRLAAFDGDTLEKLRQLIPDESLFVSLAGPLVSTFGERAPEWLMRSASSPEIDRARLLDRLPNADTAVRRRQQLEESLSVAPLTDAERAALVRRGEILTKVASGVTVSDAVSGGDPAVVSALLPDAAVLRKRAKQLEVAGDPASVQAAALLRSFDAARVTGDEEAMARLASEIFAAGDLGATLLPSGRQLDREIERLRNEASGEEDARRRESLEREYELWNAYAVAFLEGDDGELLRVGALLRPDREPPGGRVSVHDAAFWLPPSVDEATSQDGSRFGDWLLADDRGVSALRSDAGRRSLGSAALEWGSHGGEDVPIKDLADRAAARNFGGHSDPVTLFFASHKVSPGSASETLEAMRRSADVPTPFPVDSLFEDAGSGLRGYFLPRTDPRGMQLGVLTDCCQHPASAGRSCAFMGQEHPSGGFFVVENAAGEVVAQSWVWAGTTAGDARSAAVFDNIEARLSGESADRKAGVVAVYALAASALGERFDVVTVGAASDVPLTEFPLMADGEVPLLNTVGYQGYSDARQHRVLHEGVPGLRFVGREDGFEVSDGGSTIFVERSGRVHCAGEADVELAQRALASSTFREYEVVDASSGVPTGVRFSAGVEAVPGWSPDLTAAPVSYSEVSAELLGRMSALGVTHASAAEEYLRVSGFDPQRAARLVKSGWLPHEVARMTEPYPSLPEELRAADDPGVAAARSRFIDLCSTPLAAQAVLSRDLRSSTAGGEVAAGAVLDVRLLSELPPAAAALVEVCDAVDVQACVRAALTGAGAGSRVSELRESAARQNWMAVSESMFEVAIAARELADAGLSAEDVSALHMFRSLDKPGLPPALLDAGDRELWASLSQEERRLAVERVEQASERFGGVRPYSLAGWVGLPANLSQQDVSLLASADPYDPRRALAVVEALHPMVEDVAADVSADPARLSRGLPPEAGESLRSYREKVRYIRGDLDDLSVDDAVKVVGLDVAPLVDALESVGLSRNYGENMPEFMFSPSSVSVFASVGPEGVRSLGRSVFCQGASTDDLALIADSGMDVGVLDQVQPVRGTKVVPYDCVRAVDLGRALRAGVEAAEVEKLARSGASLELLTVALYSPACRDAVLSGRGDREVLEGVARWACGDANYWVDASETAPSPEIACLLDLAGRSTADRDALIDALRRAESDGATFRDLVESLPSAGPVIGSLGGLREVERLLL